MTIISKKKKKSEHNSIYTCSTY